MAQSRLIRATEKRHVFSFISRPLTQASQLETLAKNDGIVLWNVVSALHSSVDDIQGRNWRKMMTPVETSLFERSVGRIEPVLDEWMDNVIVHD